MSEEDTIHPGYWRDGVLLVCVWTGEHDHCPGCPVCAEDDDEI